MSSNENQQALIDITPSGGIQKEERLVPFGEIEPPENAPMPDPGFIKKVEAWGVLQNICVVETDGGDYRYRVVAGRRRWRAVNTLRLRSNELSDRFREMTVDVYLNLPKSSSAAAVTLIENHQRSANPLADAEAVRKLREDGLTPEQITAVTGFTKPQQDKAMRLFSLLPELREFVLGDKLKVNLAERIANLKTADQKKVLKNYERRIRDAEKKGERTTQRIIAEDYSKAREVERDKVMTGLPEDIFSGAPPDGKSAATGERGDDSEEGYFYDHAPEEAAAGLMNRAVLSAVPDFEERVRIVIQSLLPDAPAGPLKKWLERGNQLVAPKPAKGKKKKAGANGDGAEAPPVEAEGSAAPEPLDRPGEEAAFAEG